MKLRSAALYSLFFLSGAAGLGFQMAWSRMFAAGLGHEMPAVLAVVGALFGGMAAGAWASDRYLKPGANGGRWYAGLECTIGLWAAFSMVLIPWVNTAALELTGLQPPAWRQWLIAFALPAIALFPATAAMGASFPAMERFASGGRRSGAWIGGLYAANTFGAVTGLLAATFVVLPQLGFGRGIATFAALNFLCGLLAWTLQRGVPSDNTPNGETKPRWPNERGLAGILCATGLLGIGYEVLGVRVLREVLENTVYTYAAVLAVYLFGTAAGAAAYHNANWRSGSLSLRQGLLLATSIACVIGVWILAQSGTIYAALDARMARAAAGVWRAELLTAGCVFFVPTFLMGATFSHLLELAKGQNVGLGRAIALNTLGAAFGPVLFGVLLLPVLGAKWSFALLAFGYMSLALPLRRRHALPLAAAAGLILAAPAELRFVSVRPGDQVRSYRQGVMESVAVVEHSDANRSLTVDNRFTMGGTGSALAERRHASIPLLLHPKPKHALFLGLGTGITFSGAGPHAGLQADAVELVPEIVESLPWFQPQNALPADPGRFRIYVADARRFVRVCPSQFDVIVADLFHPAKDGAGTLYALEHYRTMRERLAPGGIVCQWLPLFQLSEQMLRVIIRTYLEVFPDTRAFLLRFSVDTPVLGLIAGLPSEVCSPEYFSQRVQDPDLRERLNQEQIRDGYHLLGCFLAGPQMLRAFCSGAPCNTDDQPVVLFGAPEFNALGAERPYHVLMSLLERCPPSAVELFAPGSSRWPSYEVELEGFMAGRNEYLRGLVAEAEGRQGEAVDRFVESARLSPLFSTGYAQCLSIAMREAKTHPEAARQLLERLMHAQPSRPVAAQLLKRLFPGDAGP